MSDDSDWEEEAKVNADSEDDEDANFSEEEDKKPAARKTPPKKSASSSPASTTNSKQKKRRIKYIEKDGTETAGTTGTKLDGRKRLRRVNFDALDDTIDMLPSTDRMTDRGGYMHTKNSRMKISQANSGNVPWNKGKNRTDSAKAKISAGVRARNQAILIVKLQKLGMTEEEWFAKKKKLKLVREKVRKAKVAVQKYQANNEKMKEALAKEKLKAERGKLNALNEELSSDHEDGDKEEVS